MKFTVLALGYDGTIARKGQLDPDVRAAIRDARTRGIAVVLVTGRILADLRKATGDLDFVDAVVAENGAVLVLSGDDCRLLGEPPPASFLEELHRRSIAFGAGQCVVVTRADAAPEVLAVIRDLELPLIPVFNRDRLLVVPQAVSKSIGLREALTLLHLSAHNAIAIGDAENDHDLLAACEFAVAVSWGSKVLQAKADAVLTGDGPSAVADYVRRVAQEMRLPPERIDRARLVLGTTDDGHPLALAARGRNILVAGDPRSGKSWVTGLMCEQLILQGYSLCVIDAEGDYRSLEALPGVVVFGGATPPPELPDLARVLHHPYMSVVVDVSHVPYREKVGYLSTLLPMLASLRRNIGLPHRIVVDEAHYFLHEPNVRELVDFDLGAYTIVTYRLSDLYSDMRKAIEAVIVKRTTDPHEVQALLAMVPKENAAFEWQSVFADLTVDQAVLLPGAEESGGTLCRFQLSSRRTPHVRHKAKYMDLQLIERQGFVFTDHGKPIGKPARTLNEFVSSLGTLPIAVLDGHARRGDFSEWIGGIFHDHALASDVRKVEQRYRLGHTRNLYADLAESIRSRYELPDRSENAQDEPTVPVVSEDRSQPIATEIARAQGAAGGNSTPR
jgi:hydroxymethylpyrimidine pyrophosphatase-like HAD family hydrolase